MIEKLSQEANGLPRFGHLSADNMFVILFLVKKNLFGVVTAYKAYLFYDKMPIQHSHLLMETLLYAYIAF